MIPNTRLNSRIAVIRQFFSIMGVRPIHIVLPVILSFISAGFDGIGLGLLIPLAKGMVSDFSFIRELPILKQFFQLFPNLSLFSLTPNKSTFLMLVFMVFLAVVLKNITFYVSTSLSAYWHGRFQYNVYNFLFKRFMSFGKLFFDRTNQGYINMVLNYSDRVMEVLEAFESTVNSFFTLTVYFVVMLFISWQLTVATLCVFPLLHFSLRLIIKKLQQVAALRNQAWTELHRNVFNILSCIPLVKAYSREEETKEKYSGINEQLRKIDFNSNRIYKLILPIQEVIITVVLLLMIAIVALLLEKDKPAEIAVFVVFFYAARRSLPMFNIFNELRATLARAKPPLKEILKVMEDKDKFFVTEGTKEFQGLKERIDFTHLNFSYLKEVQVLKDVSLTIEKGKMTAIVGPTGAGKTTLISLLMRFYDCPPASIFMDGTDIREFSLKSLRRQIALVSQEVFLFNDTLRNNMLFGLDRKITQDELVDVAKQTRIYDFIMSLPSTFDTEIGDRGVKLSGGEKQRAALTRALLKGSEIIILDEATSSLDSQTEALIQQAINEVIKSRTAIVIAHRLSTIKNADKIVVIEEGRIVEQGALNELLAQNGKFASYWQAQKFY